MKLPQLPTTLACTITWAFISFSSYPARVWAQSSRPINNIPSDIRLPRQLSPQAQQQEPDFTGYGRPGRRTGGGSRSPCPPIDPPLTALVPETNWGKTVAERPSFWFYVPYSPQQAPAGEFVLQSEQGNDVYRTPVKLPKTPGFVSFTTPPTAAPLETNKWYRWYFKLYCEPQKSSAPVFVDGWVQRVALTPTLKSQLQAATRDYAVYATNGIWYDALAHLAELRLTNPVSARLDDEWADLLSARGVSLEQLRQEPIVGSAILAQRLEDD